MIEYMSYKAAICDSTALRRDASQENIPQIGGFVCSALRVLAVSGDR